MAIAGIYTFAFAIISLVILIKEGPAGKTESSGLTFTDSIIATGIGILIFVIAYIIDKYFDTGE